MSAKTITFYNNKGGVGKTFIAVNTAMALAMTRQKVLLLELNFQSGHDIDKMLRVPCQSLETEGKKDKDKGSKQKKAKQEKKAKGK